jgi:hypothetical protein
MQELVQNNKKYQKYILSKFKRTLRKTRRRREKKTTRRHTNNKVKHLNVTASRWRPLREKGKDQPRRMTKQQKDFQSTRFSRK